MVTRRQCGAHSVFDKGCISDKLQARLVNKKYKDKVTAYPKVFPNATISKDVVPFLVIPLPLRSVLTVRKGSVRRHTRRVVSIVESRRAGLEPMYSVTVVINE